MNKTAQFEKEIYGRHKYQLGKKQGHKEMAEGIIRLLNKQIKPKDRGKNLKIEIFINCLKHEIKKIGGLE